MKDLFNKITGNVQDEYEHYNDYEEEAVESLWDEEDTGPKEHPLQVDVFQDENNLYINAYAAGIEPNSIDIDISRDMITIKGESFRDSSVGMENYFQQELTWGQYAQSIMLPKEIDIESSSATSQNGILKITLPKIDKDRRTKLRVN